MNIRREQLEGGVQHLVFDQQGSGANVFNRATLKELNDHVDEIGSLSDIQGLVLSSAKKSIFIAGADIKELLSSDLSADDMRAFVKLGQDIFSKIARFPFPTVAAIHGAAMGGGCEISLACDYRIASDDRSTKIGLPETQLGILPAWGGSTRLPRLLGLSKALDIILGGKRLAAKKALRIGLVDAVVPHEHLLRVAGIYIGKGKRKPVSQWKTNNPLSRALIRVIAGRGVAKKTHGHYPAIPKALDVVVDGVGTSEAGALALEADAIVSLVDTDVCRNLVRVFFLTERSKNFRVELPEGTEPDTRPVDHITVVGAGVMGAGIAQWSSARGQDVILKDINNEALNKGMQSIGKVYAQAAKRRIFTRAEAQRGMDRVYATAHPVSLAGTDLVIEAATENMALKKTIFQGLAEQVATDALLATNTSGLSITELSEVVPNSERVVGIHYFNPVSRMQLVEVIQGNHTSPVALDRAVRYVQKIGKLPVAVKDSPGFVVNRILLPYLVEAGHLFANGADVHELDAAMLDFGMPMGPMRLIDEVGIDVCQHVAQHLGDSFGERMPVPEILNAAVKKDLLGRKNGKGFYLYSKKGKGDPPPNPAAQALVSSRSMADTSRSQLQKRMVLLMVNEAARCLEEGLVAGPEDIDFAMIFGTGFAPFRGGPLRYADAEGGRQVVQDLKSLESAGEARFAPCTLLVSMAEENKTFYEG